jgi:hypothetical protein
MTKTKGDMIPTVFPPVRPTDLSGVLEDAAVFSRVKCDVKVTAGSLLF